jgi:hypothetical protein
MVMLNAAIVANKDMVQETSADCAAIRLCRGEDGRGKA